MLRRREFLTATATLLAAAGGVLPIARAQGTGLRIGALNPVTGAGAQYGSGMQATIKGVVDRLRRRGLVVSTPDPEDQRRVQLAPSAAGRAAFEGLAERAERISRDTLAPLSSQERRAFLALLSRLV